MFNRPKHDHCAVRIKSSSTVFFPCKPTIGILGGLYGWNKRMHLELMICTCSSYLKGNFFWEPSPKKSTLLYHHHLWPKIFCIRRSSLLAFTSLSNAQSNKRSSCKHVQCILAKGHTQQGQKMRFLFKISMARSNMQPAFYVFFKLLYSVSRPF